MIIEKFVIDYLSSELTTSVYAEEPDKVESEFILVEKLGSGRSNYVDSAQIAVQSYSYSLIGAATLNETVKEAMLDLINEDEIASIRLNNDCNFTDVETKRYRYQAVFDITLL